MAATMMNFHIAELTTRAEPLFGTLKNPVLNIVAAKVLDK